MAQQRRERISFPCLQFFFRRSYPGTTFWKISDLLSVYLQWRPATLATLEPISVKQSPGFVPSSQLLRTLVTNHFDSMPLKNFPVEGMILHGELKQTEIVRLKIGELLSAKSFKSIPWDTELLTLIYACSSHNQVTWWYRYLYLYHEHNDNDASTAEGNL